MRWDRICREQRFITVLLLAIGLSSYGCKDSVSISEDVQVPLASLTVTPGTLLPGFFSNTTNYTFNAPTSSTSVIVTAIPRDNTATVTINNAITTHLAIPLGAPGSITTITIVLSSSTGGETTYTVNVTRLLSSDNNLSALNVTPGTLTPAFASDTENYTVNVGVLVDSVSVSATKSDPTAMMLIGSASVPPGTASGQTTIPLGGPGTATPVTIEVTAPNSIKKTYRITINRAAPSGDNNLSSLTVTPGSLTPAFTSGQLTYTVDVATSVTSVTVTATLSDTNASMMINGQGTSSGQARDIGLGPPGPTSIEIVVTAPNGSPQTYRITVNRAAPASDNNLLALMVTPGTLTPVFDSGTTTYSVNVGSTVTNVTVTATLSDTNATMTINGQGTSSDQARDIPLGAAGSSTEVNITVIAPSSDQKIYLVTVIRPLPSNSDLSALTVTPGTLVPDFVPSETIYSVNVPLTVSSVTISATKSDPDAEMSGDVTAGVGTTTGEATISLGIPLIPTTRTVNIAVRTQDGITTKNYTITINRGL